MRSRSRALLTGLALAAVMVLAVLASVTGAPWEPAPAAPQLSAPPPAAETPPAPEMEPGQLDEDRAPSEGLPVVRALLTVLGIVAVVVLVRLLLRLRPRRRSPEEPEPEVPDRRVSTATGTSELVPDLPVLRRGVAEAQRELTRHTDPHDAVIAAWLALEEAAADAGEARQPWQTPTELATAVLGATEADPAAVRDLLRLYHRARFATGPSGTMTAEDVATAGRCLRTLAEAWAVRA